MSEREREKQRLQAIREMSQRLDEINLERQHLEYFIRCCGNTPKLRDDIKALLQDRIKESKAVHKQLIRLATKPKGYQTLPIIERED